MSSDRVRTSSAVRPPCGSWVWGAFIAIAALGGVVEAQSPSRPVADVRLNGNQTFPDDSLSGAIATRETRCKSFVLLPFCWADLDFAMERHDLRTRDIPIDRARIEVWYRLRGFREVAVDTLTSFRDDGSAVVSFSIEEGRPVLIDSLDFTGPLDDPDAGLGPDLLERLPLGAGARLDVLRLDATRDTLIHRLRNRGYAFAEVFRRSFIPTESPYSAEVSFDIEPGERFAYGDVLVSGTRTLDERTVMNTVQFAPGDVYSVDELLDGQIRLFGMEIVRTAQVTPQLDRAGEGRIPVSVSLVEGDAYRVRGGSGWTSTECMNAEAEWTSRNFLGGGRVLRLRSRVSNILTRELGDVMCPVSDRSDPFESLTWLASAEFTQPWIFSTRNALGVSVFAERQSIPDIFIRRAVGLQFTLTRSLGQRTPLTLSYRPERSELQAAEVLFCTGFLVCTPEDISVLSGTNVLAPVGLSLTRDRSNDLLNPTRGYRITADFEHAADWTGSDFRYDRVTVEGTRYMPVGDLTVATRLRGGWVGSGAFDELMGDRGGEDIVHPQKRFYAGGANSVRGFAQGRLGPRVLTVADPGELLKPVSDGGAGCSAEELMDLSCDASQLPEGRFVTRPTGGSRVIEGNLEVRFPLGGNFEGVTFGDFGQVWARTGDISLDDLEFTPGVGVRFLSPVGPIRIDVGYRFRGAEELAVVSSGIQPATGGQCPATGGSSVRCIEQDGMFYVQSGDLAVLSPLVLFGDSGGRLQLHFSIGQAF